MKLRPFTFPMAAMLLVVPVVSFGGEFRCGMLNTTTFKVNLRIPRPPDAFISKKNAQVTIAEAPGRFAEGSQLRLAVERALAPDFNTVASEPETIFRVSVVTFDPPVIKRTTQTENRNIKVGQRQQVRNGARQYDKQGNPIMEDVYEDRRVPVDYWEANAQLQLSVNVVDGGGILLDGFTPSNSFQEKKVVSVNGVASGQSLLDERAIRDLVITRTVGQFIRRYTRTFDSAEVLLACGDEFRVGNKMAIAGDWDGAIRTWEAVKLKKPAKTEGDRNYNIAVAQEAIALSTLATSENPQEAGPVLAKALAQYRKASELDPGEKYIRNSATRVGTTQRNFANAVKQYEVQKFEAEKLLALANAKKEEEDKARREKEEAEAVLLRAKEERQRLLTEERPDTPEEAKFRPTARLRIKAASGSLSDDEMNRIVAMGREMYKLDEIKSERVVFQEVSQLEKVTKGLKAYDENFRAFVADGVISKDERAGLHEIATSLALTPTDVTSLEANYKFKDLSITAPAKPARPKPQPTAPKSAVATVPVPAPQPKPAAVPQPASTPKPGIGAPKTGTAAHSGAVPKK